MPRRAATRQQRVARELAIVGAPSEFSGRHPVAVRVSGLELVRRGVDLRWLAPGSAREQPAAGRHLDRLQAAGAQIRVLAEPPIVMAIKDRGQAFVAGASDTEPGERRAVQAPHASVLGLVRLFDYLWGDADPWASSGSAADDGSGVGLRSSEVAVLGLLCSGHKDETIGLELEISVRTVRRIIAGLCSQAGVKTRFELGVAAVRRKWV